MLIGGLSACSWGARYLLYIHNVPSPKESIEAYSEKPLEKTLDNILERSGVNYARLQDHPESLHRYVASIAKFGPLSTPKRFRTKEAKLAYYLNAYNALVLYGVWYHKPLATIREVRGWIEPKAGFGFFWAQLFLLDGRSTNLYDLENSTIRSFDDARIHAAINCASKSCPLLYDEPFEAKSLNRTLDRVTQNWVASDLAVTIHSDSIIISSIFDWYEQDFVAHARALDVGNSTLDWIAYYLPSRKRRALKQARQDHLPVRYAPYDWSLNRAR